MKYPQFGEFSSLSEAANFLEYEEGSVRFVYSCPYTCSCRILCVMLPKEVEELTSSRGWPASGTGQ